VPGSRSVARNVQGDHAACACQSGSFVRVFCASVQYVGESGAIVGLQQLNDIDAPHHRLDLPVEMPLLLDAMQADAFQAATFGFPAFMQDLKDPLDSLALCEIRVRLDMDSGVVAELVIAEDSGEPARSSEYGLFNPLDSVTSKRSISVSVSDALAVAMRFTLPLLIDAGVVLRAGLSCLDRARLERMLCRDSDEECDVELMMLRERLADVLDGKPMADSPGFLIDEIKPFAWYWAEQTRAGTNHDDDVRDSPQRALRHYQHKFRQLRERQDSPTVA